MFTSPAVIETLRINRAGQLAVLCLNRTPAWVQHFTAAADAARRRHAEQLRRDFPQVPPGEIGSILFGINFASLSVARREVDVYGQSAVCNAFYASNELAAVERILGLPSSGNRLGDP
jgi:hypothetical protein